MASVEAAIVMCFDIAGYDCSRATELKPVVQARAAFSDWCYTGETARRRK